ncbi:hypothetical protein EVAR_50425_1 [Eumeta japonica]|uniref:Uncharacterized protein n=1 Tax=Eumeta variegata TaxID=151549 RepID=A0A4C1WVR6_EUMVA|nr:hypothetical protein EVAR_50425_1 [Eumeta japonica]
MHTLRGNHPANYKGCIVYKELQNIKYPNTQPNKQKLKRTEKPEAIVNQTQTKAEFTGPKSHMQILWKATRQRIQPTLNNRWRYRSNPQYVNTSSYESNATNDPDA